MKFHSRSLALITFTALIEACAGFGGSGAPDDNARANDRGDVGDTHEAGEGEGAVAGEGEGAVAGEGEGALAGEGEGAPAGEGEGAIAGEGEGEGAALPDDDAAIVDAQFPTSIACGAQATATVTVQNLGVATWTESAGFRLGGVDDSDPFAAARVTLDGSVATSATHTFTIALQAPAQAGTYTSDWRMVHDGVDWFGATTSHDVVVEACPGDPPADFDFANVTIENSPSVGDWAQTAKITGLDLGVNGVHVDFSKRDGDESWPDVPFGAPGDSLEYTVWIVLDIDGKYYASGCIEFWRGLDRNGGGPAGYAEDWYYDANRWGPMTGYQPAVGERVGFLVTAGDARNNGNTLVNERSNVVFVDFPDENGAVFNF